MRALMTAAHANDNLVCEQWCDMGVNGGKWGQQWWAQSIWQDCWLPSIWAYFSIDEGPIISETRKPALFQFVSSKLFQIHPRPPTDLEQLAFCGEGRRSSYGDKYDAIILSGHMALAAHALSALKHHPRDAGIFIEMNCYHTCNVWSNLIALSWVLHPKCHSWLMTFQLDGGYFGNAPGEKSTKSFLVRSTRIERDGKHQQQSTTNLIWILGFNMCWQQCFYQVYSVMPKLNAPSYNKIKINYISFRLFYTKFNTTIFIAPEEHGEFQF